jgi:hypothetical protein
MTTRRRPLWCIALIAVVALSIVAGILLPARSGAGTKQAAPPAAGLSAAGDAGVAKNTSSPDQASLTAALETMAAAPDAPDFAVAVLDHRTGLSYTFHSDDAFQTASVVKVEILAELLLQARQDNRPLTTQELDLATAMIRQSDNDAATALWTQIGDVQGLTAADAALGLTDTVPGTGGWWGLTTTTVSDQVKLLDTIADPDGPLGSANQVIIDLMGSVDADQNWGVSAAAETGESTALKNGWMTSQDQDGRWTVNSVGRITGADTDATLAVLTRGHTSLDTGIAFVENIAKLTRTELTW